MLGLQQRLQIQAGSRELYSQTIDQIIPIHVHMYIHDLLRYYFIVYGQMDANNNSKAAFKEKIYYLES